MKYLVDSDWAIHVLRGSRSVADRLALRAPDGIAISEISVAELYHGVFRSSEPANAEVVLLEFLSDFAIIGLNEEICRLFGEQRARLQTLGTPVGDFDLLIGCTAVHHDLKILTNNRKDFERIEGVTIETL